MKVKIKKLHPNAVIPFKKYPKDFCYDCVAISCEELSPNVYKYRLGFALQIDRDPIDYKMKQNLSIDIRPRSSICNTGLIMSNSIGTVDEPYTGEISVMFYHVIPSLPIYKVGDKVAQMTIGITYPISFIESDDLIPTDRGNNGYGSTGV